MPEWPEDRPAAVTITFDGGYAASADHALPMLSARGLPSTWFLVADTLGGTLEGRKVADASVWRGADPALVEVGNHSATHPLIRRSGPELARHVLHDPASVPRTALRRIRRTGSIPAPDPSVPPPARPIPARQAVADFALGRERLMATVGGPVSAFAYPSGRASTRLQAAVVGIGHTSARTSRAGWNVPGRVAPMALRAQTWMQDTDRHEARAWVEHAVETGAWLIEVFHLVDRETDYPWTVTPDDLAAHLDDLRDLGVWVETQSRVVEHLTTGPRSLA
jgi:peptidoglycan/xylan/chitin deacetylase (PgdA/CDA1 family)